ncbi:DUF1801 domain-containing protein [Niabella pedocola]|uniref:DUF1801 domain-containing protein n=1 Tax=Niabella pedocola TaxID=1752077 RepID=A0ABS8PW77_9BACT|nr:DUF1801 domain-containing protein [Niabella pedocola]MCD2425321.1 DUF1801 domain-containing protein [Niabella pedocola]
MNTTFEDFLTLYPLSVQCNARLLRQVILGQLPGIDEQLDLPAKMIAYSYGPGYADLICVILPSKKGLKLGFNKGPEIQDPDGLLQGTSKTTRYVTIDNSEQIQAPAIARLLTAALEQYKKRAAHSGK